MKRLTALFLALVLLLGCGFAEAGGGLIMCFNCTVNGMSSLTFDKPGTFTAIAAVQEGQSVSGWKLNGKLLEGETYPFLVFNADGNTVLEAVLTDGSGSPAPATVSAAAESTAAPAEKPASPVHVKAIGAHLQYLDAKGNAAGDSCTEMVFDETWQNPVTGQAGTPCVGEFRVTADRPHQADIAYWVLNGVRYDFVNTVKFITVTELKYDLTIEVVYKNAASQTIKTPDAIQSARTGETLLVRCLNAKMGFVSGTSTTGGGYFTEFDFTEDYTNKASNQTEKGGRITLKVIADMPKIVDYWLFNEAKLVFNTNTIICFFVRDLDASMIYIPNAKGFVPPDPNAKYKVTCTGCTFSGGGYTNATSGIVKAGTYITVHMAAPRGFSYPDEWVVNGVTRGTQKEYYDEYGQRHTYVEPYTYTSFSLSINRNTHIEAYYRPN